MCVTGCGYGTSAALGATWHQPGHRLNPPHPEMWLSISNAFVPLLWTTERGRLRDGGHPGRGQHLELLWLITIMIREPQTAYHVSAEYRLALHVL